MDELTFQTEPTLESDLRALLKEQYKQAGSWRVVGSLPEYKGRVSAGTLCSIAKGYPIPKKRRVALGLPPVVEIPACSICGGTHTHKHDEAVYDKATSHPTANRTDKRSGERISIHKRKMDKACRTIVNNLEFEDIIELSDYLNLYVDAHTIREPADGKRPPYAFDAVAVAQAMEGWSV